jgi:hypothetical protein
VTFNASGESRLKIVEASRDYVHRFKNLKKKIYNCNAEVFSRQKLKEEISS